MWGTARYVVALGLAVALAGCGGAGAGGDGDPATLAPAGAQFYAEAVVRPEGSQREDALDAAGKVLLTDEPEARMRELVEQAIEESGGDLDYARDVEPWLGERVAVWVSDPGAVAVLAASDADEARGSLEALLGESPRERSHRGSDYLVDASGVAAGVVGDFVAVGPEAQFKRAVDASEGASLAEADEYAEAVGALEDERLAHVWLDTAALIEGARAGAPELDRLGSLVPLGDLAPIAASFTADGDSLAVETHVRSRDLGPLAGGGTPLLQDLPGDSWAAFGSSDVGEAVSDTIQAYGGALGAIVVQREVQQRLGLDLDRDLLDWVGDVGFFVRGSTPQTVDGGLVIQPTDEGRAADAFGRIVGALQLRAKVRARPVQVAGADQAFAIAEPRPIVLARGSGLVVATTSRAAAEAALGSGDRLGDTDLYAEAEDLVGMEPGLLLSMPALIELVEASGPDAEFEQARPYLEAYSTIAAGSTADDDVATGRLAAGLLD